ncbi:MAG: hypothetical protein GY749_24910 [Desulfobacteraceae bacterium]|nr:hypothetical protein [Desulfobacteraceae bacterium]
MIKYPIIEEVRKARDEYAKQFNYDLDAICRYLKKKQEQPGCIMSQRTRCFLN